jgi:flagellar hook protein FlgE
MNSPATTVGEFMDYLRFASHIDTSAEVTAAAPAGYVPGVGLNSPAGDPANSIRLNVTGNVGAANSLAISDTAIGLNFGLNAASNPVGESRSTFITGYDSLGNPVDVRVTLALESRTSAGTTWRYFASSPDDTDLLTYDGANNPGAILGSGVLSFDNGGRLISATNTNIAVTRENTGAEPLLNIDLDFTSLTALADVTSTFRPDPRAELAGVRTGTLTSFSIAEDGTISGSFDNGLERPLGRLVLAQFDNAEGLIDLGGNNFRTGPSSGQPILTDPGSIGSGTVLAGRLEQSNVDISREFINMIITTTGYSASSRVISTSDRLLTELLNVSR